MKAKNLIGSRFGRLLVIERKENDTYYRPRWLVRCDCGKEFETLGNALTSGNTKSCGCFRIDYVTANNKARALPSGESCFNHLFKNYKHEADRRNLSFELTEEQFRALTKRSCFYCGNEPERKFEVEGRNGPYIYNGIDRWDNLLGYTELNSVPCCGTCNWMKHAQSAKDFINACQKVSDHQSRLVEHAAI
jgi:hypothetical protein